MIKNDWIVDSKGTQVAHVSSLTPTQYSTALDKAKFIDNFIRFVESGFKFSKFTKDFYKRLSMCFGHIAHYNQHTFYDYWFADHEDRVQWINQVRDRQIYGIPSYTHSDVEKILSDWMLSNAKRFKEQSATLGVLDIPTKKSFCF